MRNAVLDVGNGQVRTIRLYGKLGAMFGRKHRMAVGSAAEAVRALSSQLRGFEAYLTNAKDRGFGFAVFYGKRNLTEDDLRSPCGNEDIRIAPIVFGAKNGGVFQIIVGIVILVVSVILDIWTDGAFGTATGGATYTAGWAMIVGGVIQLLTPHPKAKSAKDRPDNQPNYSFNGPLNTQAQGYPVPVLYGELIVGSAVLSAGILAVDVYVPQTNTGAGGGSDFWNTYWSAYLSSQ